MPSPLAVSGMSLFAVAAIGAFAWNIYYQRFLTRVQAADSTVWAALGRPPHRWYGYKVTHQFLKYFQARGYEVLKDPVAVALGRRARASIYVVFLSGATAVALLGASVWHRT
jgi:hypothetical protein